MLPFPLSEKLLTEADFLQTFYANSKVEEAFAEVIPWLYERGALDIPEVDASSTHVPETSSKGEMI